MNDQRNQCGIQSSECGRVKRRGSAAHRSACRIPPSAFPNAVTLLEVLISMGILTIGILGVAALFPVGSHYMLRGEIYDRADAAAAQALNDAVTRGVLDPERWVSFETGIGVGAYTPASSPNHFTRPFVQDMRSRRAVLAASTNMSVEERQRRLVSECGSILFIDPVGVAQGINQDTTNLGALYSAYAGLSAVPASLNVGDYLQVSATGVPSLAYWQPWIGRRPIQRLTLSQANAAVGPARPLSISNAERLAAVQDDLASETPNEAEEPTRQQWTTVGNAPNGLALNRLAKNHFSFLLSVVPSNSEAWHNLAHGGRGHTYDVSAVVLYRRPDNRYDPSDGLFGGIETIARAERMCRASVVTSGTSGGEVQLFTNPGSKDLILGNEPTDDPEWKHLKVGSYVFLFGPRPTGDATRPALFGQWYRTVAIDESTSGQPDTSAGPTVALRGPDWPWPGGTPHADPTDLRDDLKMLIIDGAVAVHTRTMRLDAGTAWRD